MCLEFDEIGRPTYIVAFLAEVTVQIFSSHGKVVVRPPFAAAAENPAAMPLAVAAKRGLCCIDVGPCDADRSEQEEGIVCPSGTASHTGCR